VIDRGWAGLLERAVKDGLRGAALVDREGRTIARAGAIDVDEAMPFVALVLYRRKTDDLGARLFAGEVLTYELDDKDLLVAIAKRQLFVVAATASGAASPEAVVDLRDQVAYRLGAAGSWAELPLPVRGGGRGGDGGAGPAELPVVEWGVTVGRERGKA